MTVHANIVTDWWEVKAILLDVYHDTFLDESGQESDVSSTALYEVDGMLDNVCLCSKCAEQVQDERPAEWTDYADADYRCDRCGGR